MTDQKAVTTDEISYDIAGMFEGKSPVLKEQDRLLFARQILFFLFLICLFVFAGFALAPENQALAQMFELVKIGALPLVTLVVGFYFPSSTK